MFSNSHLLMKSTFFASFILCFAMISGCNSVDHDLLPSNSDLRTQAEKGSIGHLPGQVSANFTTLDSEGNSTTLSSLLTDQPNSTDAIVLYFTMWCPICLGHSNHMFNSIMPEFENRGNVRYVLVDYISGSATLTRNTEISNGYSDTQFITLSDIDQSLLKQFHASNGITVVITNTREILLNEDYRTGENLHQVLDQHLPL